MPERSARLTQKTCGPECRRDRRARQERERAAAGGDERRAYERERKRRWRASQARDEAPATAVSLTVPAVSLTGPGADSLAGKAIRAERWDRDTRVSLTGLALDLARIQGDLARIVGQVGHG